MKGSNAPLSKELALTMTLNLTQIESLETWRISVAFNCNLERFLKCRIVLLFLERNFVSVECRYLVWGCIFPLLFLQLLS